MNAVANPRGALILATLVSALLPSAAAAEAAAQRQPPTFSKEVLPILQRSCQKCHRPGTAAPMSLLTYDEARPWARSIKQRISSRQMPPWHLDRSIGEYADDISLSDEEIAVIAGWVDAGAPRGNPADAPPPLKFTSLDEWLAGEEPDMIISMNKGFTVPAEGPDFTPSEVVAPDISEDRYIKWIQVIPTAHCCVHHSNVYAILPEGSEPPDFGAADIRGAHDNDTETHLIEYAMGNDGDFFTEGTGKILKAGSKIRFSPHYHPYGKEVHDRQKIGIKFYPKGVVPKLIVTSHRIRTGVGDEWWLNRPKVVNLALQAGNPIDLRDLNEPTFPASIQLEARAVDTLSQLSIPPNTVVRNERHVTLPRPALVLNFQPHMHFRGKRMLLEAIYPDGRREVLTDVTHYEQTWQMTYTYKVPHLFPAGTILHAVSWHDNTVNNKHNPDPTAWVGWGSRTMDEMGNAWTEIAFLTDEQYQEELAKRNARKIEQRRSNQQD